MANPEIEKLVDDLVKQGRVSADLRNEYIQHFENGLKDQILRGADYTKKTQSLAEEKRQAEALLLQERQKIQDERNRLGQWEGQVRRELDDYNKVMKEIPDIRAELAAYKQVVKDYQIPDYALAQLQSHTTPSTTPTPNPPAYPTQPQFRPQPPDENKYMTREAADTFAANFLSLNSKVNKIHAKHMKLFGEPLEDDLVEHYLKTGEDPEAYWRVTHAVDNRLAEMEAKNREAYEAKIREEERAKILKEYAVDPSRVIGGQGVKGGLRPELDVFSHSRALVHSQNHANDQAAAPSRDEFVPPEKRSPMIMQRERVDNAVRLFSENFDLNNNPTTEKGRRMAQQYASSSEQ